MAACFLKQSSDFPLSLVKSSMTRQRIYKMVADGTIPSFRVGSAIRLAPTYVAEWIGRKMPKPAIPLGANWRCSR
jgi:excisionase family DNA binding protein